jgi:hypothetical protein
MPDALPGDLICGQKICDGQKITGQRGTQVCGGTVMDADSRDWQLATSYVTPMPDREDEPKRASVMRRVALRNGCRLTSRWNTFVHAG